MPRASWTDYPNYPGFGVQGAANPPQPVAHTVHVPDKEPAPIATIALPGGVEHPVYGPPRERLGFRP